MSISSLKSGALHHDINCSLSGSQDRIWEQIIKMYVTINASHLNGFYIVYEVD
mgnify:FL=1